MLQCGNNRAESAVHRATGSARRHPLPREILAPGQVL